MKRVLLTGASGFIGRQCIPFLKKSGYEIHAVYNNAPLGKMEEANLFWHQCDLLDKKQQKRLIEEIKPTHLLHFAWYAAPGKFWDSVENLKSVQATLELIKNFAENGGKRAVLAGTCAEYDWSYGYLSEFVTPKKPSTLYGVCKNSVQHMCRSYFSKIDCSFAWGRIFFLYGPHEHPDRLVPSVIGSLLQFKTARCSHGNQIRDFLYVSDAAAAFVALLESGVLGCVNIGSGKPVALKTVIKLIADNIGKQELIELGAIDSRENDPPLLVADVRRLSLEVNFTDKITLDNGLAATINWWKKKLQVS